MKTKKYELIAFKSNDEGDKSYMRLGELTSLNLTEEEYYFMKRVFSKNGILLKGIEDEYINSSMKKKVKTHKTGDFKRR